MTNLPTRLHPRIDETLYGYISRLSHCLSVPTGHVLSQLGLLRGERIGWGCLLRDDDVTEVADALTLPPHRVEQLTLRRYRHLIAMPTEGQWRCLGGWASTESVLLRGGRFCPQCLREDSTWRLVWRLPEQIGCRIHHTLLQHRCDACQGPPSAGAACRSEAGYLDYLHHPRFCYSRAPSPARVAGTHAPPCGRDLSRIPAPPLDDHQERLSALVAQMHAGQPVTLAGRCYPARLGRRVLREAMSLQAHAVLDPAHVTDGSRVYRKVSTDAAQVSRLLTDCADWLLAEDPDSARLLLADWINHTSLGTPTWNYYRDRLGADPALQPQVLQALEQFGRPSSRANRLRTPGPPGPLPYRRALPQLAWTCALPANLRDSRSPHTRYLQAVMSLQLIRRHTPTWRDACTALEVPQALQWKRNVYTKLGRQQHLDSFLTAADRLHRSLLVAPEWLTQDLPWSDDPMTGLTEGLCRTDGAGWCPCTDGPPTGANAGTATRLGRQLALGSRRPDRPSETDLSTVSSLQRENGCM